MKSFVTHHLVKYNHLNHHGTLFAGQGAEWFVECGFIAAASLTKPENIICVNVHGMLFKKPVRNGSIIRCESKAALAGKTSIVVYVRFDNKTTDEVIVDGFLTFVHVDENGVPTPHGLVIEAANEEEKNLQEMARKLHAK